MPGERTQYRKIQVVLDYAKEGKHHDEESLVKHIFSRHPTSFIYYWRDKETDKIVHNYSLKSLTRSIQLCVDLKFLSKRELAVTKTGVTATDPRRFPNVLGNRIVELFEEKGIPLDFIYEAIEKIIQDKKPSPPTAKRIWECLDTSKESMGFGIFNQLMCLLGQCKVLLMSQKRIYLPFSG